MMWSTNICATSSFFHRRPRSTPLAMLTMIKELQGFSMYACGSVIIVMVLCLASLGDGAPL